MSIEYEVIREYFEVPFFLQFIEELVDNFIF